LMKADEVVSLKVGVSKEDDIQAWINEKTA